MARKESLLFALLLAAASCASRAYEVSFDHNYHVAWGNTHATFLNQGREVQLLMDKSSGTGFESNVGYASGFFQMRIKIPNKDSTGVVTAFYLTSKADLQGPHDELDFELLGGKGQPYILHTNVFANDNGGREQRFHLWFDPAADFHTYGILWNQHQIVFFVDKIPIRVFKNNLNIGVNYPSQRMVMQASIWNGEKWADGGRKIDWSQAPFRAYFQGFNVSGCPFQVSDKGKCYAPNLPWNGEKYRALDHIQHRLLQEVRTKHMIYDYCARYGRSHKECQTNQ